MTFTYNRGMPLCKPPVYQLWCASYYCGDLNDERLIMESNDWYGVVTAKFAADELLKMFYKDDDYIMEIRMKEIEMMPQDQEAE